VALVVACSGAGESVCAEDALQYEPAIVSLTGELTAETRYGPPNYGENPETDRQFEVHFLVLSHPVSVCGSQDADPPTESFQGITKIQLDIMGVELGGHLPETITVTGVLRQGMTGGEFTEIVLAVADWAAS